MYNSSSSFGSTNTSTYTPTYTSSSTAYSNPWRSNGFDPIIVGVVFLIFILIILLAFIKARSVPQVGRQRQASNNDPVKNGLDEESITKSGNVIEFEESKEGECIVCLVDYSKGDVIRRLTVCGHEFHKDCIDVWFKTNTSCPICRISLKTPKDTIPNSDASPVITENSTAIAIENLHSHEGTVSNLNMETECRSFQDGAVSVGSPESSLNRNDQAGSSSHASISIPASSPASNNGSLKNSSQALDTNDVSVNLNQVESSSRGANS